MNGAIHPPLPPYAFMGAQFQLCLYFSINKSGLYKSLPKCNLNTYPHVCIAVVPQPFISYHVKGWSQLPKSLLPIYVTSTEIDSRLHDAMLISKQVFLQKKQIAGKKVSCATYWYM
jgi:hypothetical protein